MRRCGPALAKLSLSAIFLAVAFSQVSGSDLLRLLETALTRGPRWLGAALAIGFLMAAVNVVKWRLLLGALGMRLSFLHLLRHYQAGYFLNNILTGTGEVKRVYDVGRETGRTPDVFVSVFVERWTGVAAQAAGSFLAVAAAASMWPVVLPMAVLSGLALAAIIGVYAVALRWPGSERGPRWIASRARLGAWLDTAHAALIEVRGTPQALLASLGLSTCNVLLLMAVHLCLALALGVTAQGWGFLLLVPLAGAFGQLPVSINGIGIQELAYVELFRMAGVDPAAGLAISVLAHGVKLGVGSTGAVALLWPSAPEADPGASVG